MYAFAYKAAELEQDTPSLETLKQDVISAYEHLMKVLENWRDRRLNTLKQCHSAMDATIKAALAHAKNSILIEVVGTTNDPLENYFQTDYTEVNLLKTEIKEYEEALAKACVLSITSDLNQVKEIICSEFVAIPCEKCDELRRDLDVMKEDFKARLKTITEENEELKRQLSKHLRDCEIVRGECNRLQGEVRMSQSKESALQLNIEKYKSQESALWNQLKSQAELVDKLQSQINQGKTMHFDSPRDKLPIISEDMSVEDIDQPSLASPSRGRMTLPPARNASKRQEVKSACLACQSKIESTHAVRATFSQSKAEGILPSLIEAFGESDEVVDATSPPSVAFSSPRSRLKASANSFARRRIHLQPNDPKPWNQKSPPNPEEP